MTRQPPTDASAATSLPAGQRIRLLAVLAGSSGAAPLATDMYVPGLPELATSLGADAAAAQLSLTGFLAGIIAGQLILGPLSDVVGRRPVLLCGTIFFVVFSVGCAAAPTMTVLDAARFGQGVSGAAGIVLARAVVADLFADRDLAGVYARLGAITAAAPILAPLAGGALLLVFPWRAVFVVLATLGAVLAVGVWRWIPESRPPQARSAGTVTAGLRAMAELLARRDILGPVLAISFGGAAVFAYIAGTTFVFHDVHRLTPAVSSLVYGVNAVGNMAGSLGYGRLVKRWPRQRFWWPARRSRWPGPPCCSPCRPQSAVRSPSRGSASSSRSPRSVSSSLPSSPSRSSVVARRPVQRRRCSAADSSCSARRLRRSWAFSARAAQLPWRR
ncbi:multidrug effflux MFS transporter [Nocardia brasiliensis]|uniref:multidrug effflux MFS transporter n=1 Tax=Nocardia brasiliensis TaxID=37326 RepID=UPI00245648D4|nr:multidrug effflux MFS transporter [Nocardia brasiliensis]